MNHLPDLEELSRERILRIVGAAQERPILRPVLLVLILIFSIILALVGLSGCATYSGICAFQPIGQDEKGIAYFRYHCEAS